MPNCCNQNTCQSPYNLCAVDPCGSLVFEQTADSAGDYTLKLSFLGTTVEIVAAQVFDEPITFPLSGLNEQFTFLGQIFDEAGDLVKVSGKEWIKFSTQKTYELI